ncbi:MAG: hypothetical protein AAF957_13795 [Planctomycetota bacterium]
MSLPVLLASALFLAQADPAPIDASSIDHALPDRVLFDVTETGAQWALGHSFKACVDETGLRFIPFLGSDSSVRREATFRVRSLSAGDREVALAAPTVRRHGDSLVLDRGALVERYACSTHSIEQFLEVDLTGLSGPIRVEVDVDTNLARPARTRAPYRFGGPDAAVDVGEAFVLTGRGEKLAVDSIRTPGGYAILVPEAVTAAAGPTLVIDPVISSGTLIGNPPIRIVDADTAFVGSVERFVVVERAFSLSDSDVLLYQAPTLAGGPTTFVATIDFTDDNWEDPALAGTLSTGDIIVVATRGLGTGRRVYGRRASTDGSSTGTPFAVSDTVSENWDADIGVETGGPLFPRRFLVVWNNSSFGRTNIFARALDRDGPVGLGSLVDSVVTNSTLPAVSQSSGEGTQLSSQSFRVAYKQTDSGGQESIWSADLNRNAAVTTPRWRVADALSTDGISVSSSNQYRLPDGSAPFVVVWDSGSNFFGDIYAATCADGTVRGEVANLSVQADEGRTNEQRLPSVVATSKQWLIVYEEREVLGDWTVYMCSGVPAPRTFGLIERNQALLQPGAPQRDVSVASSFAGGIASGSSESGFAAWVDESGASSLDGAYLRGEFGIGAAGVPYCTAAPNSTGHRAWISANGDSSATSLHALLCVDAPVGTPCFILTSREPAFVPGVAGSAGNLCLGGLFFGRFSNQVGLTSTNGTYSLAMHPEAIAQPNGTIAANPGETWYFQAWFRDGSPSGPTSNLSNGVAIEFVP